MAQKKTTKSSATNDLKNECGLFHIRRASRAAGKFYADILEHAGLESSQFSVLTTISQNGPISISDIANRMGLDRTTMSRNLKPLEKKKLVKSSTQRDGRARLIEITQSGKAAIAEAIPRWKNAQAEFRSILGDEDMDQLILLMNRVYEATSQRQR